MKQISIFDAPLEPKSYHVTTSIPAEKQIEKEKKAAKQDDLILEIFKEKKMLSASEAHKIYCKKHTNIPLTSARRAISNLKKAGYLRKTEIMVKGDYGDTEHVWSCL